MGAITKKSSMYTSPIDKKAAVPQYLGIEFVSDLPVDVRKPYSLSNLTPCANLVMRGTTIRVMHMEIINKPLGVLKYCDTAIPAVMPSQNNTFQKLSLFSRTLIQSITVHIFEVHKCMLLLNSCLLKRISNIVVIAVMFFGSSVAKAQDLKAMISDFEKQYAIPTGLLYSIALVESKINPYAINVEGKAIFSKSKSAALETIKYYRRLGVTNIDIGIMQINYRWHGREFTSIEQMINPVHNLAYAAQLLTSLYKIHGSWHKATRLYHSATPKYYKKYSKSIIAAWLKT
jgi:hypothetical protein